MATPVILAENGGVTAGLKVLLNVGAGGGVPKSSCYHAFCIEDDFPVDTVVSRGWGFPLFS
jgi:hypothetical protein